MACTCFAPDRECHSSAKKALRNAQLGACSTTGVLCEGAPLLWCGNSVCVPRPSPLTLARCSLTLILISDPKGPLATSEDRVLSLAFEALVLLRGIDGVVGSQPADRLKRDCRAAFRLLDTLFDGQGVLPLVLRATETAYAPDMPIARKYLDAFAASVDSSYAALIAGGCTVAATDSWCVFAQT
eukprot:Opistho-1_new@21176